MKKGHCSPSGVVGSLWYMRTVASTLPMTNSFLDKSCLSSLEVSELVFTSG